MNAADKKTPKWLVAFARGFIDGLLIAVDSIRWCLAIVVAAILYLCAWAIMTWFFATVAPWTATLTARQSIEKIAIIFDWPVSVWLGLIVTLSIGIFSIKRIR